jgi:hypothetical protein
LSSWITGFGPQPKAGECNSDVSGTQRDKPRSRVNVSLADLILRRRKTPPLPQCNTMKIYLYDNKLNSPNRKG